jgi:hypothetical protein
MAAAVVTVCMHIARDVCCSPARARTQTHAHAHAPRPRTTPMHMHHTHTHAPARPPARPPARTCIGSTPGSPAHLFREADLGVEPRAHRSAALGEHAEPWEGCVHPLDAVGHLCSVARKLLPQGEGGGVLGVGAPYLDDVSKLLGLGFQGVLQPRVGACVGGGRGGDVLRGSVRVIWEEAPKAGMHCRPRARAKCSCDGWRSGEVQPAPCLQPLSCRRPGPTHASEPSCHHPTPPTQANPRATTPPHPRKRTLVPQPHRRARTWSFWSAGRRLLLISVTAAMCMTVGKVSLELWPLLT